MHKLPSKQKQQALTPTGRSSDFKPAIKRDGSLDLQALQVQYHQVKSIQDAVTINLPTLRRLQKNEGVESVIRLVNNFVLAICQFYDQPMPTDRIMQISQVIVDTYPDLNPGDLFCIYQGMITQQDGPLYKLTAPAILAAFTRYWTQRLETAEWISQIQAQNHKQRPVTCFDRPRDLTDKEKQGFQMIRKILNNYKPDNQKYNENTRSKQRREQLGIDKQTAQRIQRERTGELDKDQDPDG